MITKPSKCIHDNPIGSCQECIDGVVVLPTIGREGISHFQIKYIRKEKKLFRSFSVDGQPEQITQIPSDTVIGVG